MRFLVSMPLDMVMDLDRQLMQASAVANQCLPRINGCPPSYDFGCKTKKSAGYSHESTEMMRSSRIYLVLMVYRSTISKTVGAGLILVSPSFLTVSIVMTLIAAPKSTSTLGIYVCPICTVTVGFPGLSYLVTGVFPVINADSFPMT